MGYNDHTQYPRGIWYTPLTGAWNLVGSSYEFLTASGNVSNGDTVTIDQKTYTFQTVLTDVDGNVLIGASASDSLDNLVAAINLAAGAGSTYAASTTVHPTFAASVGGGDTVRVESKRRGETWNGKATTETSATLSWGAATTSGGVGPDEAGNAEVKVSFIVVGGTTAAVWAPFKSDRTTSHVTGAGYIAVANSTLVYPGGRYKGGLSIRANTAAGHSAAEHLTVVYFLP